MKLTAGMQAVATVVGAWALENKAELRVAEDPTDPYVLLCSGGFKSFVVILNFADAAPTGGSTLAAEMQDMVLEAFIGRSIDLSVNPGAWMYKDAADGKSPALLTLMDSLREELFGIEFGTDENTELATAQNMGLSSVSLPDGTPLRAFRQQVKWTIRVG